MTKRWVFLVPGFFGFSSVGAVNYFEDVERSLGAALRRRGVDARIVRCMTQPTASIPRRADILRRQVIRSGGLGARELHFVGHSTGGLDVRMLLTPDVKIASGDSEERIARLTRTASSVATPHHGTPLANHFVTVQGQTLLLVLSALATSGQGRGAILAAAKALALVARLDDWAGRTGARLIGSPRRCCARSTLTASTPRGPTSVKSSAIRARCCSSPPRGSICSMPPSRTTPGSSTVASSPAFRSRARTSS